MDRGAGACGATAGTGAAVGWLGSGELAWDIFLRGANVNFEAESKIRFYFRTEMYSQIWIAVAF